MRLWRQACGWRSLRRLLWLLKLLGRLLGRLLWRLLPRLQKPLDAPWRLLWRLAPRLPWRLLRRLDLDLRRIGSLQKLPRLLLPLPRLRWVRLKRSRRLRRRHWRRVWQARLGRAIPCPVFKNPPKLPVLPRTQDTVEISADVKWVLDVNHLIQLCLTDPTAEFHREVWIAFPGSNLARPYGHDIRSPDQLGTSQKACKVLQTPKLRRLLCRYPGGLLQIHGHIPHLVYFSVPPRLLLPSALQAREDATLLHVEDR
mmetsp:Transcript_83/g.153  ORF Transcript_83/g.153 Transcript_83/m.153 type:complete len:256 (-) Transcript_83:608-1375(-)